jgi:uncharacterized protein (TIGR04255 family)
MTSEFSASEWVSRRLPEYNKPPVVETALAIEFAPIKGWNVVQYGALWERFKARYPKVEVYPAPPQDFIARPVLDMANPPVRCLFIGSGNSQLIQIRSGAFVRNWRANQENQEYPRYRTIRPSFEEDLNLFCAFLQEQGFEGPEIWKCEVTYINHFLRGREWRNMSEIGQILPVLSRPLDTEVLSNLQQLSLAQNYVLPGEAGQIQFQLQPGIRSDGQEVLQLAITAFGKPKGNGIDHILNWIDLGHFAVVQGFTDFTAPEIQLSQWERTWPR